MMQGCANVQELLGRSTPAAEPKEIFNPAVPNVLLVTIVGQDRVHGAFSSPQALWKFLINTCGESGCCDLRFDRLTENPTR